jgi:hypothetical protein
MVLFAQRPRPEAVRTRGVRSGLSLLVSSVPPSQELDASDGIKS